MTAKDYWNAIRELWRAPEAAQNNRPFLNFGRLFRAPKLSVHMPHVAGRRPALKR